MKLILASTSPWRADMLSRFGLPFEQVDPEYPESRHGDETPTVLCQRLARGKAAAVADQQLQPPWLIIGADQVVSCEGQIFGKPGDFARAHEQLTACAGKWVQFETGVALLGSEGIDDVRSEVFEARFRPLTDGQITRYLNTDQPWDAAGSIRAEGHGIVLIGDTRGRDFNTLIGLPLMLLHDMLIAAGADPLNGVK